MDTDSYDDIHAQARQLSLDLEKQGHRAFWIPLGGSTPLGSLGYVECVRELAAQAQALGFRAGPSGMRHRAPAARRQGCSWAHPNFCPVPRSTPCA